MTTAYSLLGREQKARDGAKKFLEINPNFSVDLWKKKLPYQNHADSERFVDALRKAGCLSEDNKKLRLEAAQYVGSWNSYLI